MKIDFWVNPRMGKLNLQINPQKLCEMAENQ